LQFNNQKKGEEKMKKIISVVLMVMVVLVITGISFAEGKYPITSFGTCGNCQETGMTLSGPGILEKEVRIFHCEKPDAGSFFKVEIKKGRSLVFIVNQDRNALMDDQPVLNEVVEFIEETGNGSDERIWNRVNLVFSY
jgi:hypothetical protein